MFGGVPQRQGGGGASYPTLKGEEDGKVIVVEEPVVDCHVNMSIKYLSGAVNCGQPLSLTDRFSHVGSHGVNGNTEMRLKVISIKGFMKLARPLELVPYPVLPSASLSIRPAFGSVVLWPI